MSFFRRVAARAGAPAAPSLARAVPKGMAAARAPLRRQEVPEEDEMRTLRRQEMPEEEEMQTLRRQDTPEEEEMQSLRRQEMPDEKEMQMLRRQEVPEEELRTLRRQETPEEEEMQALRRQEALDEEEMQTLRRREVPEEEEPVQALRRQEEDEEPAQTVRRLEEMPEEEAQALRRQEEEEEEVQALRRAVPPDAETLEPGTAPKPPSFSAQPDEPQQLRGFRRDVVAGEPGGGLGGASAGTQPPADAAGAEGDTGLTATPPFWPGAPSVGFEPAGFVLEPRRGPETRPRVVIEHMDVVISEPAGAVGTAGAGRATPDLGRRMKSRYLRGL